jgi:hypothetical protein
MGMGKMQRDTNPSLPLEGKGEDMVNLAGELGVL